jgi:hypothetical protein
MQRMQRDQGICNVNRPLAAGLFGRVDLVEHPGHKAAMPKNQLIVGTSHKLDNMGESLGR